MSGAAEGWSPKGFTTTLHDRSRRKIPIRRGVGAASERARALLVLAAILAGGLGVAEMWLRDTAALRSPGEWLVAVGRVTGLEATYVMLVAIILLSRVLWLDRLVGMDRLFRWHGRASLITVWLMVTHALAIIWGYSASISAPLLGETRKVVLDLPNLLAATVALATFVGIAITSSKRLRRRLKYETWHFIHLYVYVAVALSFAHQFSTGYDFATHPLNREIWVALYVLTFGLLVWYRVAVPVYRSAHHDLRVRELVNEADGAVSMYVVGSDLLALRAEPGQFFIWRIFSRQHWWEAHPFSISMPPTPSSLRVTVGKVGDFTKDLLDVPPGTRIVAEGPFGSFTKRARRSSRVLLIAAGSGIGPVRGILEAFAPECSPTLIYRASAPAKAALVDEIDELVRDRGGSVQYIFGPRVEHDELTDPTWLLAAVDDAPEDYDVFLCGPPGLMREVRSALMKAGFVRAHLHEERFAT